MEIQTMDIFKIITPIVIFLIVQLIAGIWWASRITALIEVLTKSVDNLTGMVRNHDKDLFTRTQAAAEFTKRDVRIDACFEKVDENRNKITALEALEASRHNGG
jgi:hypothetical protein